MQCVIRFRNAFGPLAHVPVSSSAVAEGWLRGKGFEGQRGPAGTIWVHQGAAALGSKDHIQHMKGAITAQVYDLTPLERFEFKTT